MTEIYRIGYSCGCELIGVDHRKDKEAHTCPVHKTSYLWATALPVEDDQKMFGPLTGKKNGESKANGGQKES